MPDLARPGLTGGDEVGDVGALLELLDGPSWHLDALCREHPEVTWFPGQGESGGAAKSICRRCLVRQECGAWALGQGPELSGVWGGLSQWQRKHNDRAA